MAKLRIPYLVAKNGRFYFQPSKPLRDLGFEPMKFGHDERAAIDYCRARHREILAARKGLVPPPQIAGKKTAAAPGVVRPGSVSAAIAEYKRSAKYTARTPKTRQGYDSYLNRIERLWGPSPLASVTPEALAKAYDAIYAQAPSSANAFGAVARLFFRWASKRKRLPDPTTALEIEPTNRGERVATAAEIIHLVEVADHVRPKTDKLPKYGPDPLVGTAILMLLTLPHNPQDVVTFTYGQIMADSFAMRRGKTNRRSFLAVPDFLVERILAGAPRSTAGEIDPSKRVIPLTEQRLGKRFALLRAEAQRTMPSLKGLTLRDLRRTARTWAEDGGSTLAQNANLLGHSQRQAAVLATHYSAGSPALAKGAMKALLNSTEGAVIVAALSPKQADEA